MIKLFRKPRAMCEDCGTIFDGGVNAFLCPKCSAKRLEKQQAEREAKARRAMIEAAKARRKKAGRCV